MYLTLSYADRLLGYYASIFAGLQQKDISGFLTYLWQVEPCKGKWAILARAYSRVRDIKGKNNAPLDRFIQINAPIVGIIKPEDYMSVIGWEIEMGSNEQLTLRRTVNPEVDFNEDMITTNVSVDDVIANSLNLGYISGEDGANAKTAKDEAVLTMATMTQLPAKTSIDPGKVDLNNDPGNQNSTASGLYSKETVQNVAISIEDQLLEIFGPIISTPQGNEGSDLQIDGMDTLATSLAAMDSNPRAESAYSDLIGEYPFNSEFDPDSNGFVFDPFHGYQFNAFNISDFKDIDEFNMNDWTIDGDI